MKRRISIDTYIHKHDADELEEFNELDKMGLAQEQDYPKAKKELKRTKINTDSIAFVQELTDPHSPTGAETCPAISKPLTVLISIPKRT